MRCGVSLGVSSRVEGKTIIEGCADWEYTKAGDSEAAAGTTRTAVPWHRTARRERERAHRNKEEDDTLIFDTILFSTGRWAALNTSGGPTTPS
jgi:hypothetical protein